MQVDAVEYAWFWGSPGPSNSGTSIVFLGPERCVGLDQRKREALYLSLLERFQGARFCLCGKLAEKIRVRDATCRISNELATHDSIRVGDHAFSLDPLSSHGLQAAIRSGLQAGAVVHTILDGGDVDSAVEFYKQAQQTAFRRHRRITGDIYRSQANHSSEFWADRCEGLSKSWEHRSTQLFSNLQMKISPMVVISNLPVLEGKVIRRRIAVSHPRLDGPVAWVCGVDITTILARLRGHWTAPLVLADWSMTMEPTKARNILDWLMRHEIVVPATERVIAAGERPGPPSAHQY